MKAPKFSIIVPAYNVADFIEPCLNSVLNQNFQDYQLIIVDDGSTDGSSEIIQKLSKANRRIKIIEQKNSGLSAARNAGIKASKGDYLLLLDADDFLEPGALQTIASHLDAEPDLDLLRFQIQDFYEDGTTVPHHEESLPTTTGLASWPHLEAAYYTENAWAYLYSAAFFKRNHFHYAESCVAEDFGLTPLIIAKAVKLKIIPDICYNYRQRAGSIMHSKQKLKTRVVDSFVQLQSLLPELAKIEGSTAILHYLVASFLTLAAQLPYYDFLRYYTCAKEDGFLAYIHPATLKSRPRAFLAKHFPKLFYKCYNK